MEDTMLDDLPLTPPVPLWTDLYLKFSSEQAAYEQLLAAGLLIETQALLAEDETVIVPAGYAAAPGASVDYIGVIYKPTGNTITTDMGEQPEMEPLPGWHVNVRLSADRTCPEALQGAIVSPSTPSRVWA
jgi:hypothetical protein